VRGGRSVACLQDGTGRVRSIAVTDCELLVTSKGSEKGF